MKRLAVFLVLTGCATPPEKIAPVQMSGAEYSGMSCADLASRKAYTEMTLRNVSNEQQKIATNDAIGVALLGVPMGSVGGDLETSVAVEKRRLAAIEKVMAERC